MPSAVSGVGVFQRRRRWSLKTITLHARPNLSRARSTCTSCRLCETLLSCVYVCTSNSPSTVALRRILLRSPSTGPTAARTGHLRSKPVSPCNARTPFVACDRRSNSFVCPRRQLKGRSPSSTATLQEDIVQPTVLNCTFEPTCSAPPHFVDMRLFRNKGKHASPNGSQPNTSNGSLKSPVSSSANVNGPKTPTASIPDIPLPKAPDPALDPAGYLRSIYAVRERSKLVLEKAKKNQLKHFTVDMTKFSDTAGYVVSIIKASPRGPCPFYFFGTLLTLA